MYLSRKMLDHSAVIIYLFLFFECGVIYDVDILGSCCCCFLRNPKELPKVHQNEVQVSEFVSKPLTILKCETKYQFPAHLLCHVTSLISSLQSDEEEGDEVFVQPICVLFCTCAWTGQHVAMSSMYYHSICNFVLYLQTVRHSGSNILLVSNYCGSPCGFGQKIRAC